MRSRCCIIPKLTAPQRELGVPPSKRDRLLREKKIIKSERGRSLSPSLQRRKGNQIEASSRKSGITNGRRRNKMYLQSITDL